MQPKNSQLSRRPSLRPARYRTALAFVLVVTSSGCSYFGGPPTGNDIAGEVSEGDQRTAEIQEIRSRMLSQPSEPYWAFRLGELYTLADSTEQAISNLQYALKLDQDFAPAISLLSKHYYEAGVHHQAVNLLRTALSRNPDAPDALRAALALNLDALEEFDEANTVLADCSKSSQAARAAYTYVTLRGEEAPLAIDAARQSVKDNPNNAANHNNYGISLLFAGKPVEAREAFMKALKIDKALPGAAYNLAIVETFYFFNEESGREWFARYLQIATDDPDDLASVFGSNLSAIPKKSEGN